MRHDDLRWIRRFYEGLPKRIERARNLVGRQNLTATEKLLYAHLDPGRDPDRVERGVTTLFLRPDRVAMQDATAQMAMLQFMQSGRNRVAVPSTIHCDHLIRARRGASPDLQEALLENDEVYEFLRTAAARYGIGFWKPGSGIIHQVVLEKYAFPGGLMIGTDSHTPNAGGLGMLAIGVGGADAAETMAGLAWTLRAPRLVGVHLKGRLSGWTSAKDVILYLCGKLTTSGGTNRILEYFGPGARSLSATGRATITNMGAEMGATTSIFPFDERTAAYLRATERAEVADLAERHLENLVADAEVEVHPEDYFDELVEVDLDRLEPYIVGPHSPDRARPLSALGAEARTEGFPVGFRTALIGSCTNSSYEDLERAAHVARQAAAHGLTAKIPVMITPGSQQVMETITRDGQLQAFEKVGATVLANACGPCIGMWKRDDVKPDEPNAILTSYNRNFPKRNDGSPSTLAFIASPEIVMAIALSGRMDFNPLKDPVVGLLLSPPTAPELPPDGFALSWEGYLDPPADGSDVQVQVKPGSGRLELLEPFEPWDGKDFEQVPVLVKTLGQTTTDHISPAGRDWLPLRGHLSGISHNLLHGAVDAETGEVAALVEMPVAGRIRPASPWALKAMHLRDAGQGSIVVGDRNFGEGSSREHAAMSPRFLGVKAVLVRSFARIHETNLKKQGILPLTFTDPADYERIHKDDRVSLVGLGELAPGHPVRARVKGREGEFELDLHHTLTEEQVGWFRAGSALNAAAGVSRGGQQPV